MRLVGVFAMLCVVGAVSPAASADYSVAPLNQAPPSDELGSSVAEQLAPTGLVVKSGKRTLCEIWPRKNWDVKAQFKQSNTVIYPLEPGELIGVVRYARKAGDFRGQQIGKGVYTLRYALQPQDGNHIGTSDTRDFLLLFPAEDDQQAEPMSKEKMFSISPKAAGGTHPAMLSLLAPEGDGESPDMFHEESRDLWSLRLSNPTLAGDKEGKLTVQLVLVGSAPE